MIRLRRRRDGIRSRLVTAFVSLALAVGAGMALTAMIAGERVGDAMAEWHFTPIMVMLIDAEERAWKAADQDERPPFYGSDLAERLGLRFHVGKQIPAEWRDLPDGFHFFPADDSFAILRRSGGVRYALGVDAGRRAALRLHMVRLFLLCLGVGLVVAALLGLWLSRRIGGPFEILARAVRNRGAHPLAADAAPLPPCDDLREARVLANAIRRHERALLDAALRERRFAGDVSHELRTPLTVLRGGLEILEARLEGSPRADALRPVLERMTRTVDRMAETTHVLLMLAREASPPDRAPTDVAALLRDLIAGRPGVTLEIDPACADAPMPDAHAELLGIAIGNLLDNARKYADDGRARVILHPAFLEVRNRGCLPEGVEIFAPGARGAVPDARGRTPGGSGLGLSIVRRICERLGWSVDCREEDGETVFVLRMPSMP